MVAKAGSYGIGEYLKKRFLSIFLLMLIFEQRWNMGFVKMISKKVFLACIIISWPLSSAQKDFHFQKELEIAEIVSDSALTVLGRWAWGPCFAVATKEHYAFIGNGALFQVLDISEPSSPKIIGEVMTEGIVYDIVLSANYAFSVYPFQIIDITSPASPEIVFSQPIGMSSMRLAIDGDYVYIGDFGGVVHIINKSNPLQPEEVGSMLASGKIVTSIAVADPYLYATTVDGLLIDIFDISDKTAPVKVGEYFTGGIGNAVKIEGRYLYEGDSAQPQFKILDISTPAQPQFVGGLNLPGAPREITIRDSLVYVSLANKGFSIVNIADKAAPKEITNLRWIGSNFDQLGPAKQSVADGFAYLASGTGLWIVDLNSKNLLATTSFFPTGYSSGRVSVQSNYAYIAASFGGLKIVDYMDSSTPKLIGAFPTSERAIDVATLSDRAFLLTTRDFIILDVSNPETPVEISKVSFDDTTSLGFSQLIGLSGSTAIVARASKKFSFIDISNLKKPRVIEFPTSGVPVGLSISGLHLFIAEGDKGLGIYHLGQPFNPPLQVALLENIAPVVGVLAVENKLFVAAGGGLSVLDIKEPVRPINSGQVDTPGGRTNVDLAYSDNVVYMAYNVNLEVIDVSNPQDPRISGYLRHSEAFGVAAHGNLVFVGNGFRGLLILKNDMLTSVRDIKDSHVPNNFMLQQNYPNPFNSETMITYELQKRSNIRLNIYNVMGEIVLKLLDTIQEKGKHEIRFSGKNLSSGIYYIVLETKRQSEVKRAILLK